MASNLEMVQLVRARLALMREQVNLLLALEAELLAHDEQEIARDARAARVAELRAEMRATGVDDTGWTGGRT